MRRPLCLFTISAGSNLPMSSLFLSLSLAKSQRLKIREPTGSASLALLDNG